MTKQELKNLVIKAIDENKEEILIAGREIYQNPELGFKEFKTTETIATFLEKLGIETEKNIAVTGCKGTIKGKEKGLNIAILGELDSVSCTDHCDSLDNGAVHACGHNIQIAGMLGAALGLTKSGVMKELVGKALVGPVSNGFIGKQIKFIGKESHAGSAPHEGINALNAAMLSINNIHAQRETFKDTDRVRVHPIITKGGDIVNSVPADVRMESYVRARTIEGMLDSNKKVDRAIKAGAMAVGADVEIVSIPGYLPILRTLKLDEVFAENLRDLGLENDEIVQGGDFTGSFDFGDVSHLMPTLHPMIGGITGNLHTREYKIVDEELAYLIPAKAMALSVIDLLFDNGKIGNEILEKFEPKMSKKEYLEFMEQRDKMELFKGNI